ncbi:hypothetical protein LINJ_09_1371 [Leishmania infantum JPCM5]|uniref:Uncharacterized protein n=2 Tax=Leishmania infantum TaxID=5671 RepID=E9AG96_LEIIN|nr:hypothetical protein LINJ_09_1371 [Leishmania infantum JPCM5]CAC9455461.1 hypothetical_protein_-__conserved [Leishmania infantum]CBZ08387.1 hypothetical protein LINJ_09_1371 [Leishmania infantum JPCM5]SUZ39590.1 hypothetical_protein_-__conserved [Leishmania infantum]|eukprot:XP_003392248.1 hypothetical protein LINJ_09_1371 [Leishmania infantum JPCM5]
MLSTSPPQFDSAAAASDVVILPSSPDDDSPMSTQGLTPERVAQWTLKDVENHIFFMVWVCGIPVHVRYIVHVLEHSAVIARRGGEQIPHGGSTRESLTAVAQADVLAPVCRRAAELRQVVSRWPIMATLPDLQNHESFSELVSLGVLSEEPEHEGGAIRPAEGGERWIHCGSAKATASSSTSSLSCSTVHAGAVTPAEGFANVAALALRSPAERDGTSLSSEPSATWCAQAYWTAWAQAQQWIAGWPTFCSDAVRNTGSLSGIDAAAASAWPHLRPACALTAPGRRRLRGGDAPITSGVVVVDADEGDARGSTRGAGPTFSAANDAVRNSKAQRREAAEVVVIDSDDDDL